MRLTYMILVLLFATSFSSCEDKKKESFSDKDISAQNLTSAGDMVEVNQKNAETENADANNKSKNTGDVIHLTTEMFVNQIYDYKANPREWVYKGDKPAIIDFYADWCGPCKRVAPIMDDLAKEYEGQIKIYKIDTDKEKELAGSVFGIRSIPSILFIPANGQPLMEVGAFPKQAYVNKINKYLLEK